MTNVGTGNATRTPGTQVARKVESRTSSEPQPVTTQFKGTPNFSLTVSRRSSE